MAPNESFCWRLTHERDEWALYREDVFTKIFVIPAGGAYMLVLHGHGVTSFPTLQQAIAVGDIIAAAFERHLPVEQFYYTPTGVI